MICWLCRDGYCVRCQGECNCGHGEAELTERQVTILKAMHRVQSRSPHRIGKLADLPFSKRRDAGVTATLDAMCRVALVSYSYHPLSSIGARQWTITPVGEAALKAHIRKLKKLRST